MLTPSSQNHWFTAKSDLDLNRDFSAESTNDSTELSLNEYSETFEESTDTNASLSTAPLSEALVISKEDAIAAYKKCIDFLLKILSPSHTTERKNLKEFSGRLKEGINRSFSDDVRVNYINHTLPDFQKFCKLLENESLSLETRQQAIQNICAGLDFCTTGIQHDITSATRVLEALSSGISQNFITQLYDVLDEEIFFFIQENNICEEAGEELHFANGFFNYIRENFQLPERKDALIQLASQESLEKFAQSISQNSIIEKTITKIAGDCLDRIHKFYKEKYSIQRPFGDDQMLEMHQDFEENLKSQLENLFGPIEPKILFTANADENLDYRLVDDDTLLAHCIAHNLRKAGAIEPFKAAYIIGKKSEPGDLAPSLKLKQLGENLFYVKETDKSQAKDNLQGIHLYVLQNPKTGKDLAEQLTQEAQTKPSAKSALDSLQNKLPFFLAKEMSQALTPENAIELFENAISLPGADKEKILLEALEQARIAELQDVVDILFNKLDHKQIGFANKNSNQALEWSIKYKQKSLTDKILNDISSELLSLQDENGYTILHFALFYKNHYAVLAIIKK